MATDEVERLLDQEPEVFWRAHPEEVGLPVLLAERFRELVSTQGPVSVLQPAFDLLDAHLLGQASLQDPPIVLPIDERVMREIERWNVAGAAMLVPEFAQLAQAVYARLLRRLRELQEAVQARLHKGTPYHMLGYARLFQDDPLSARDYFRLAAFEDAFKGDGWREEPAANTLTSTWRSDVELEFVASLVKRGNSMDRAFYRLYVWNPEFLMLKAVQEAS
jgi:hypothetical protein